MIITISGKPGSGKSTLAKMLAEKLGYKRYYMGGMRREMARQRGITLQQLNTLGETEAWTDKEVDEFQKHLGETEDNFVVEGRTSFLFIPRSLKVFIDVEPAVGAERVFHDLQKNPSERNEDSGLTSVAAVLESHVRRIASDTKRYENYYHTNIYDLSHYDYVLDTTHLNIRQCFDELYAFIIKRLKNTPTDDSQKKSKKP